MPDQPTFVIVGASLAGGRAAQALHKGVLGAGCTRHGALTNYVVNPQQPALYSLEVEGCAPLSPTRATSQ